MGVPNQNEATFSDGQTPYVNVNTVTPGLELQNGAEIRFYSDSGSTLTSRIKNGNIEPSQSATAVATANSGTIATANLGVSRVNPAGNVTGIILQAGTIVGQQCWVVNESSFTLTMAASGTSGVADGVSDVIAALTARLYIWDSGTSLWYKAA